MPTSYNLASAGKENSCLVFKIEAHSSSEAAAASSASRAPQHVVCLVDTSGSMDETSPRGPADAEESSFTRLDLAKHTLVVLVHSLGPADTLCLISFSSSSTVIFETSHLDDIARERALAAIAAMRASGGTNMWDGLKTAMRHAVSGRASTHMLLLTDGCATDEPPEGLSAAFAGLYRTCSGPVGLHTIGFGYGINSKLLQALAATGSGVFAFVPDATMIGTTFVNILSSILATAHVRAQLLITASSAAAANAAVLVGFSQSPDCIAPASQKRRRGSKQETPEAPAPTAAEAACADNPTQCLDIGSLQVSQHRTVTLQVPRGWQGQVTLQACTWDGPLVLGTIAVGADTSSVDPATAATAAEVLLVQARDAVIQTIGQAIASGGEGTRTMQALHAQLNALAARADSDSVRDAISALAADAWSEHADHGQLGHAVASSAEAQRWGLHYLRSEQRAHSLQLCLNFRDAGLQAYAAPLFRAMQAHVEGLFCTLPAPTPTGQQSSTASAPTNMSTYYTTSGG